MPGVIAHKSDWRHDVDRLEVKSAKIPDGFMVKVTDPRTGRNCTVEGRAEMETMFKAIGCLLGACVVPVEAE